MFHTWNVRNTNIKCSINRWIGYMKSNTNLDNVLGVNMNRYVESEKTDNERVNEGYI